MAIYHFRMKKSSRGGKRLSALAHLNYINREGRYSGKEDLIEKHTENLPPEFRDINEFWKTCEAYERVNANLFRELEIALPKELTREENMKLVKEFSSHLFGKEYVYNYSIHQPQDYGGDPQPHVHIMFCERKLDGIPRPKEQFFKQHYTRMPERSGAKKNEYWNKKEALEDMRKEWEKYLNFELEKRGIEKVSRKSLKDQKRDAEANRDYEKARELDRKPIEIDGSILYRNEKKLTEKERMQKEIFNSNRILKSGSEYIKKLTEKIKKLRNNLEKMTKEEYEILERIREIDSKINITIEKMGNSKIENTVYNLMSNKEYYNLLNDNKKIEKDIKKEKNDNRIKQLKIRKNKNLERIEDIKREIKNNPKKRYIFSKRTESIKLKYEKKIKELEKEKKEYINEINERFAKYKNPKEEMYSIQHLHHILNEKGEKELRKIEKEFNEIMDALKINPEVMKEEKRIRNRLTKGEYEEIENEIYQLEKDIEFLKKEIQKHSAGKEIYEEMLQDKHEVLHQKKMEKENLDRKIRTSFSEETEKSSVPEIREKTRVKKIIENLRKTKKLEEILKKEERLDRKKQTVKKKRGSRININGTGKSDEIRGNFTLKDLEYLDELEKQ